MGHLSYIQQQIEHFRAALKVIEDQAQASPEDEGLRELKEIFTNRIWSLEMLAKDNDESAHEAIPESTRFHNAA